MLPDDHLPNEFYIPEASSIKVLIADDEMTNRLILEAILKREGYQVIQAVNGEEAVTLFASEQADIILMDVMMPVMDGFEATKIIKESCSNLFVPVIFLTAMTDETSLVKCIESGGDDFLTKPYNHVILRARMNALLRITGMYNTIQVQKQEIQSHQERMEVEANMAESMFRTITHSSILTSDYIKYILDPMSLFSGDMLVAAAKPSGGLHIMLGDFTGHGMGAATGALPASAVFYEMTAKGYCLADIVTELNSKMKATLPMGMFLAGCLLDFNPETRTLSAWIGGVPSVVIYPKEGKEICHKIKAHHLPLGILSNKEFDAELQNYQLSEGDRVYICSDGITELTNENNEMFGQLGFENLFNQNNNPDDMFDEIKQAIVNFQGDTPQTDDVTLAEIRYEEAIFHTINIVDDEQGKTKIPAVHWQLSLTLDADSLQNVDPIPIIIQSISELQGLHNHRQRLHVILTELFSNALEHGLLKLDSTLKNESNGYAEYYQLRTDRLMKLNEGKIIFHVKHALTESGGRLVFRLEDSGEGFDYSKPSKISDAEIIGRGLPLIYSLCDSVEYLEKGNIVEAVFLWSNNHH